MLEGLLFVVSGPSGVGKGTVIEALMQEYDDINYSISATTRSPRADEVDGIDYFFLSEDKFIEMQKNGEFIECAKVHNNYYGTPRSSVIDCLEKGKDIILEIDIQGARQVKREFEECILIFLLPPSLEELEKRLNKRGTESEKSRKIRLENARRELKETVEYDYEVVNDEVKSTVNKLKEIIIKEKSAKKGAD